MFEQGFGNTPGFFLHSPETPPPAGAWIRAELAVDFTARPAKITLVVDGKVQVSKDSQLALAPAAINVGVGVTYTQPSPAFQLDTDDVLVELE